MNALFCSLDVIVPTQPQALKGLRALHIFAKSVKHLAQPVSPAPCLGKLGTALDWTGFSNLGD